MSKFHKRCLKRLTRIEISPKKSWPDMIHGAFARDPETKAKFFFQWKLPKSPHPKKVQSKVILTGFKQEQRYRIFLRQLKDSVRWKHLQLCNDWQFHNALTHSSRFKQSVSHHHGLSLPPTIQMNSLPILSAIVEREQISNWKKILALERTLE